MQLPIAAQTRRFYDGGTQHTAPVRDAEPVIVLSRTPEAPVSHSPDVSTFRMARRIGYDDRVLGELLVPGDLAHFETDLTSVPFLFAWLVPRTGAHLPAALLHDGLVHGPDEPASYISTRGLDVDRPEANRVFRDAMADTGTGVVRRWLMWSAVTTATMLAGKQVSWSRAQALRYRLAALGTVVLIIAIGVLATLDLFDVTPRWLPQLPWMGHRPFLEELAGGAAAAVVIPFLVGLCWGRFWRAGVIIGIGLALLLHVTFAILGLTALYQGVERLATRRPGVAVSLGLLGVLTSVVVLVLSLLG